MDESVVLKPEDAKVLVAAMALLYKMCDGSNQAVRAEADPIASLIRNFLAAHSRK